MEAGRFAADLQTDCHPLPAAPPPHRITCFERHRFSVVLISLSLQFLIEALQKAVERPNADNPGGQ